MQDLETEVRIHPESNRYACAWVYTWVCAWMCTDTSKQLKCYAPQHFFFSEINQALGSHNYFITHFGELKGRLIALSGCCWVGKQDLVSKEIGTSEWEPPVHWGNFNFHGKQCAVWVSQSGCVTGKTKQNKNHLTSLCFVFLICEVGMVWVPSISMGE